MRSRPLGRRIPAALLLLTACTSSSPGPAPPEPPSPTAEPTSPSSPEPSTPTPTSEPPREVAGSVRLDPPEGGSFLVRGAYPRVRSRCVDRGRPRLTARYPGTLSVERSEDGTLALTVTLPFDEYLKGIAEVPSSWPMAALEAQAIAARSYALAVTDWHGVQGDELPTPICATAACQVYRGIPVPFRPEVRRWYRAVRRTEGLVLLHEGSLAETVYFSTSNGRTYGNDEVFGSAPLPYLRPVEEHDDGASPTSRWSVRIPFGDLGTFLHAAGRWPRARTISDVRLDGGTVVVSGEGVSRSMELASFREAVNAWAPCLMPDRYPTPSRLGTRLPVTIPSRWLDLASDGDAVVVEGRGWGHGAGMVQWGAYGKARRGLSAAEILAYYYGGLRPEPYPEPGLIHVEVAGGLTWLRVVPSGPGALLEGEELGTGPVTIAGGDQGLVVSGSP